MSARLSKVLNVSLEDYIAKKGIVTDTTPSPKPADVSENDYFKRPLRSEMETDDENESDMKDNSCKVERIENENTVPVEETTKCRDSATKGKKSIITGLRLSRDDPILKNSSGASSVMSVKAVFERNSERLLSTLNENVTFKNVHARNRINRCLKNNLGQRPKNEINRNNVYRSQYGKNPNMTASFNPSFHLLSERSSVSVDKNQITDLRQVIQSSTSQQLQDTSRPPAQFSTPQLITFADMLSQIGQSAGGQSREMFANAIRNMMCNPYYQPQHAVTMTAPMMNSTELMPMAAQTFLNYITTVQQNFGPKYDMKLQEEIHTLQNKSMLYHTNGVVSMDGPGIDSGHFNPVTTDVSMNMRFS